MNRSKPFKTVIAAFTAQIFPFFSKKVLWTAPISALRKLISIGTALIFFATSLGVSPSAFASAAMPEVPFPYQIAIDRSLGLVIPQELGKLEHFNVGQGDRPAVFHIQTAHGHYQAQQQIRQILHYLDEHYGVRTVLVEGSAFQLEPELLNFFPKDKKLTQKINDALTKRAIVKGPELYLLEAKGAKAYGIEDLRAYRENGVSFVKVLEEKQKTQQFLADMNMQIERLASHLLNKDLRDFLRRVESFETNKIPFDAWLANLKGEAQKRLEIDLADVRAQVEWPMLVRLFRVQDLAAKFDKQKFPKEREAFLKAIRHYMPDQESRVRRTLYQEIEQILMSEQVSRQLPDPETSLLFEGMVKQLPKNFNYEAFPNVRYFIESLLLQSELPVDRLMPEVQKLSTAITEKLTRTQDEKKLVALLADHRLLQKLFALELLPADYDRILLRKDGLKPSKIVDQLTGTEYGVRRAAKEPRARPYVFHRTESVQFTHISDLDQLFASAMKFYAGAKERDTLMMKRVEERLNETGAQKVAVITGGFHAEPFHQYFADKKYTYVLISPRITGADDKGHAAYIENVLNSTAHGARLTAQEARGTTKSVRRTEHATRESFSPADRQVLAPGNPYGLDQEAIRSEVQNVIREVMRPDALEVVAAQLKYAAGIATAANIGPEGQTDRTETVPDQLSAESPVVNVSRAVFLAAKRAVMVTTAAAVMGLAGCATTYHPGAQPSDYRTPANISTRVSSYQQPTLPHNFSPPVLQPVKPVPSSRPPAAPRSEVRGVFSKMAMVVATAAAVTGLAGCATTYHPGMQPSDYRTKGNISTRVPSYQQPTLPHNFSPPTFRPAPGPTRPSAPTRAPAPSRRSETRVTTSEAILTAGLNPLYAVGLLAFQTKILRPAQYPWTLGQKKHLEEAAREVFQGDIPAKPVLRKLSSAQLKRIARDTRRRLGAVLPLVYPMKPLAEDLWNELRDLDRSFSSPLKGEDLLSVLDSTEEKLAEAKRELLQERAAWTLDSRTQGDFDKVAKVIGSARERLLEQPRGPRSETRNTESAGRPENRADLPEIDIKADLARITDDGLRDQLAQFLTLKPVSGSDSWIGSQSLFVRCKLGALYRFDLIVHREKGGLLSVEINASDVTENQPPKDVALYEFRMGTEGGADSQAIAEYSLDSSTENGHEPALMVSLEYQHRYIGTFMAHLGLFFAKKHGVARFVVKEAGPVSFYEQIGFVRTASDSHELVYDLSRNLRPLPRIDARDEATVRFLQTLDKWRKAYSKVNPPTDRVRQNEHGFKLSLKRLKSVSTMVNIFKDKALASDEERSLIVKTMAFGQGNVFRYWGDLTDGQKRELVEQLKMIDQLDVREHVQMDYIGFEMMEALYQKFGVRKEPGLQLKPAPESISAPTVLDLSDQTSEKAQEAEKMGRESLRKGEVGVLELAGGTGSRLGYDHPKIMFHASPILGKSLGRMRAEKIRAQAEAVKLESERVGHPIPWLIMTSDVTDKETRDYLESRKDKVTGEYFGIIPRDWVKVKRQRVLPLVTHQGEWILELEESEDSKTVKPGYRIAVGGFGHGDARDWIMKDPEIQTWLKTFGIRYVVVANVDNALLPGLTPKALGYHIQETKFLPAGVERLSKIVVEKTGPEEKVGVSVLLDGKDALLEYNQFNRDILTFKYAYRLQKQTVVIYRATDGSYHVYSLEDFNREINGAAGLSTLSDKDFEKWVSEHLMRFEGLPGDAVLKWNGQLFEKNQLKARLWLNLGSINALIWSLDPFMDEKNPLLPLPVVVDAGKKVEGFDPESGEVRRLVKGPDGKDIDNRIPSMKFEIMAFHGFASQVGTKKGESKGAHILANRLDAFAPIKEKIGPDSPKNAKKIFSDSDAQLLKEKLNWNVSPSATVELNPAQRENIVQTLGRDGALAGESRFYLGGQEKIRIGSNFHVASGGAFMLRVVGTYGAGVDVSIGDFVDVQKSLTLRLEGAGKIVVESGTVFDYPLSVTLQDKEWLYVEQGSLQRISKTLMAENGVENVFKMYQDLVVSRQHLDRAFLILKLVESFIANEPEFSAISKNAVAVKHRIDDFEIERHRRSEVRATEGEIKTGVHYWAGLLTTTPIKRPFRASQKVDVPDINELSSAVALRVGRRGVESLMRGEGYIAMLVAGASQRMNVSQAPMEVKKIGRELKSKAAVPIGFDEKGRVVTYLDAFGKNLSRLFRTIDKEAAFSGQRSRVWENDIGLMTNEEYQSEHVGLLETANYYGLLKDHVRMFDQPLGAVFVGTPADVAALEKSGKFANEEAHQAALAISENVKARLEQGEREAVILEGEKQPLGHGEFLHQLIVTGELLHIIDSGKKWIAVKNVDNYAAKFDKTWIRTLGLFLEEKLDFQPEVSPRSPGQKGGSLIVMTDNGAHQLAEDPNIEITNKVLGTKVKPTDSFWFNDAVALMTPRYVISIYKAEGQTDEDFIRELRKATPAEREAIADRGREKFPSILDAKPAKNSPAVSVKRETNMWQSTGLVGPDIKIRAVGVRGARNLDIEAYATMSPAQKTEELRKLRFLSTKSWTKSPQERAKARQEMEASLGRRVTDKELFVTLETYEGNKHLANDLLQYIEDAELVTPGILSVTPTPEILSVHPALAKIVEDLTGLHQGIREKVVEGLEEGNLLRTFERLLNNNRRSYSDLEALLQALKTNPSSFDNILEGNYRQWVIRDLDYALQSYLKNVLKNAYAWKIAHGTTPNFETGFKVFTADGGLTPNIGKDCLLEEGARLTLSGAQTVVGDRLRVGKNARFVFAVEKGNDDDAKVMLGEDVTVQDNVTVLIRLKGKGKVEIEKGFVFDYPVSFVLENGDWLYIERGIIRKVKERLEVQKDVQGVWELYHSFIKTGRLNKAKLIRSLMDSFLQREPDLSDLYVNAKKVKEMIDDFEEKRHGKLMIVPPSPDGRGELRQGNTQELVDLMSRRDDLLKSESHTPKVSTELDKVQGKIAAILAVKRASARAELRQTEAEKVIVQEIVPQIMKKILKRETAVLPQGMSGATRSETEGSVRAAVEEVYQAIAPVAISRGVDPIGMLRFFYGRVPLAGDPARKYMDIYTAFLSGEQNKINALNREFNGQPIEDLDTAREIFGEKCASWITVLLALPKNVFGSEFSRTKNDRTAEANRQVSALANFLQNLKDWGDRREDLFQEAGRLLTAWDSWVNPSSVIPVASRTIQAGGLQVTEQSYWSPGRAEVRTDLSEVIPQLQPAARYLLELLTAAKLDTKLARSFANEVRVNIKAPDRSQGLAIVLSYHPGRIALYPNSADLSRDLKVDFDAHIERHSDEAEKTTFAFGAKDPQDLEFQVFRLLDTLRRMEPSWKNVLPDGYLAPTRSVARDSGEQATFTKPVLAGTDRSVQNATSVKVDWTSAKAVTNRVEPEGESETIVGMTSVELNKAQIVGVYVDGRQWLEAPVVFSGSTEKAAAALSKELPPEARMLAFTKNPRVLLVRDGAAKTSSEKVIGLLFENPNASRNKQILVQFSQGKEAVAELKDVRPNFFLGVTIATHPGSSEWARFSNRGEVVVHLRSEARSVVPLTPVQISYIQEFYENILPLRFFDDISRKSGLSGVVKMLQSALGVSIPAAYASTFGTMDKTAVLDHLVPGEGTLVLNGASLKIRGVSENTIVNSAKAGSATLAVGQDLWKALIKRNPRALYYLLRSFMSVQSGSPAIVMVGDPNLVEFIKVAIRAEHVVDGSELGTLRELLKAMDQGKILKVIQPQGGESEASVFNKLAKETQGGIATLHLDPAELSRLEGGVHFAFSEDIGGDDLMVAVGLGMAIKSIAELIRNIPDPKLRGELLMKMVTQNLPGVRRSGANAFIVEHIAQLAQEFVKQALIARSA